MAPSLTAAAFSTGAMGFFMNFSGTLFTQRFGIFICLLMIFGWAFGAFFLLPLLSLIGPLGKFGEIAPCLFEYGTSTEKVSDQQVIAHCVYGPGRRRLSSSKQEEEYVTFEYAAFEYVATFECGVCPRQLYGSTAMLSRHPLQALAAGTRCWHPLQARTAICFAHIVCCLFTRHSPPFFDDVLYSCAGIDQPRVLLR